MRTIVDIPYTQIKILDKLTLEKSVSRAQIIREAIASYIASQDKTKKAFKDSFGIWKKKSLDSLSYVREIRDEWEE